jgi:glycosyltransferase involved in cell wall biosynthesis
MSDSTKAIHPLVWCPLGLGDKYHAPGLAVKRLYEEICNKFPVYADVAHGKGQLSDIGPFGNATRITGLGTSRFSQIRFLINSLIWVKKHIKKFDILHAIGAYSISFEPALSAQKLGVPSFLKLTNSETNLTNRWGLGKVLRTGDRRKRLINALEGIICISQDIYNELLSYNVPERKLHYIPNGVDTAHFHIPSWHEKQVAREALGLTSYPVVLFCGAVVERKRPHLLLEAASSIPDVQVVLVGPEKDPSYSYQLHNLIRDRNLQDRVTFVGFKENTLQYYHASDIFCLPSRNEGMPNALLEAVSCGLPTVCTKASGIADIIGLNERGLICEPNPHSLADCIRCLLNDSKLQNTFSHSGRTHIEMHYSMPVIAAKHYNLFKRTIS